MYLDMISEFLYLQIVEKDEIKHIVNYLTLKLRCGVEFTDCAVKLKEIIVLTDETRGGGG